MEAKNKNQVTLDLRTIAYWSEEENSYVEKHVEDTSIFYHLDEDLVDYMINMHADLHGISYYTVKEAGEGYIESAIDDFFPEYKVLRVRDLLEETLGFDIMKGVEVEDEGSRYGIKITYTDEAIKKLNDLYSEYGGYELADKTMQAIVDGLASAKTDYDMVVDCVWSCIDEGFDKDIQKILDEEKAEEEAEEDEREKYLADVEKRLEEARKISKLTEEEFDNQAERLADKVDDILEFSPKQLSDILLAMQLAYQFGRVQEYLDAKKEAESSKRENK